MSVIHLDGGHLGAMLKFAHQNRNMSRAFVKVPGESHFATLAAANAKAYHYRYVSTDQATAYEPDRQLHEYRDLTAVEQLYALDSYEYQTDELDGYTGSDAATIIETMRRDAIHRLPGYSNAKTWAIKDAERATVIPLSALGAREGK